MRHPTLVNEIAATHLRAKDPITRPRSDFRALEARRQTGAGESLATKGGFPSDLSRSSIRQVIPLPQTDDPRLLVTSTREPFQPARLYFSVPSKAVVTNVFAKLGCMEQEPSGRAWSWLYHGEAKALTFGVPYAQVPAEVQPIVLGRFKFPDKRRMVLEVRSFPRAYEAAKFFGPILGAAVIAERTRVINRWFQGVEVENGLARLDRLLDANVTVIDPLKSEAEFEQAMASAKTPREKRLAWDAYHEDKRKQDVPLVEDFPLAPEEETPDFFNLTMTLQWRAVRAWEHWRGNTHLTLADIIHRTVEQGIAAGTIQDMPWPSGWERE